MEFPKLIIGEDLDPLTKVYRYISLKQFLHMVENKRTYLTRVSSWEDTWEIPSSKLPTQHENGKLEYALYSRSMDLFGQCWTLKEESDAMWRIYSPTKDGIKIGTSIQKFEFIEDIKHFTVHGVLYYSNLNAGLESARNIKGPAHLFKDGLIKRDAFDHESEVRMVTLNDDRMIGKRVDETVNYLELSLDANRFIEDITVDPRAEDYYVDTIKNYCNRLGLKTIPHKSSLYDGDIFGQTRLASRWIPVT